MRPFNLIPPEKRRGDSAPSRAGAASYVVVAALLAALLAVTALVLTSNSVADKKAELASAQAEQQQTEARANALHNFASFQQMQQARSETITQLAQSRFDWERILHEVSRVLPDGVWLTSTTGTVAPGVEVDGGAESSVRDEIPGPALSLVGCAKSQEDVAALSSALGDIDGVTRVLVTKSAKPPKIPGAPGTASGSSDAEGCGSLPAFEAVAAFDAVSVPASTATTPAADAQQVAAPEEQQQSANIAAGTAHARKAAGLIGAGGN